MLKKLAFAVLSFAFCIALVQADEYRGKVKAVNGEKRTITVTVTADGKDMDMDFVITDSTKLYTTGKGKKGNPGPEVPLAGGVNAVKIDAKVVVTTDKKDDKVSVTSFYVEPEAKKKKKKKDTE